MVKYFEKEGQKYQEYEVNGETRIRKYVDNKIIKKEEEPVYKAWRAMRKRCQAKNAPYSRYYYYKGITVCDEWNNLTDGFRNFYEWAMDNGYQEGLSIDRIDSNKNYCPENCRWITVNENRYLGLKQEHVPKWEYKAFNKELNLLLIFYKAKQFEKFTGIDSRRVTDGCNDSKYECKGWKFGRDSINTDYYGSQETIPNGSTLDVELPTEVRVIYLDSQNR